MTVKKVKLFTHTDLDGVGCGVVAAEAFGKGNVDITYCDYDKIDNKVSYFLDILDDASYDLVLITDISVNEEVAEKIEKVNMSYGVDKIILLDHHATASWLNMYHWATVTPIKVLETDGLTYVDGEGWVADRIKTAGTSMLFDYCMNHGYLGDYYIDKSLSVFVETVRRWDTWDWMNLYGGEETPKTLNSYLYLIGRERFFNRFVDNHSIEFDAGEQLVLELEAERIKNYIEKVSRGVRKLDVSDYTVGLVFAEQYISELGNHIANVNPDIDFAVIVNLGGGTVSYRGVKNELDLGAIVKPLDGGGHPKAAGSKIPKNLTNAIVGLINNIYLDTMKGRD